MRSGVSEKWKYNESSLKAMKCLKTKASGISVACGVWPQYHRWLAAAIKLSLISAWPDWRICETENIIEIMKAYKKERKKILSMKAISKKKETN